MSESSDTEQVVMKNKCCRLASNLQILPVEDKNEVTRSVFKCNVCNNRYYGKISDDVESIEIIDDIKKKGFSLEGTIIHGISAIKYIIPDIPKLIQKTREFAKTNKIQCTGHNVNDIIVDETGIFCKHCGLELTLVPAWIIGKQ